MAKKEKKLLSGTAKIAPPEPGKPLKVVFEPGCFDHIDVQSLEELDRIMAEIQTMFATITPEELEAQPTAHGRRYRRHDSRRTRSIDAGIGTDP